MPESARSKGPAKAGKQPARPEAGRGTAAPGKRPEEPPEAEDLDLLVERIDTEGVMKEGFTGQEM